MSRVALNHVSLFTGYGGFELAFRLAGINARTILYCDIEPFAHEIIKARIKDGYLDDAPIWPDIRTLRGEQFRGLVDIVTGGFPCQDLSTAGKRAGITGSRSGLWFEMLRFISEVRPRYVFVENVSAILSRGVETVLGGLAEIGYDAEWAIVSAADCGAPHKRERFWLLAHPPGERWHLLQYRTPREVEGQRLPDREQSRYRWRRKDGRHSMECVGWTVEPDICGSDDAAPDRVDRLKALGNGLVPVVAAKFLVAALAGKRE